LSHVYLPLIAPIVKETCKEFDIKYIEHTSVLSAINSCLNNFVHCAADGGIYKEWIAPTIYCYFDAKKDN